MTADKQRNFKPEKNMFFFTTRRPVAITMLVLGFLAFGFLSYRQLALTLMPNISYPSLTVRTEYPGTAPEEVENAVSRPVEEALSVVSHLVNISSISREGRSDVILELDWDTDINDAIGEIRERLDMVILPDEADKPLILRYDPSLDPIMRFSLSGDRPLTYMRYIAEEQLKRELEALSGVAAVKVKGGYEEEILIELDELRISTMGLNIQTVKNRLAQENINLAGGKLKEGETEYIVRTLNEFNNLDDIRDITLGFTGGRYVRLGELARVSRSVKDREIITKTNGKESVELEIYKEADANIVQVAQKVRDKIFGTPEQQAFIRQMQEQKSQKSKPLSRREKFRQAMKADKMTDFITHKLPSGMHMTQLTDQSVFIKNSIDEVKSTAMWGGVLAVLVLLLFLRNIRSTLIVGISIPISVLVTFAPMNLFQVSLNIMSLGGLALGIGMLVDNSIVVLESIFRCREEGDEPLTAVVRGVSEVGAAVIASTLTTVAVFFPMVFVKGVAGQIFGDMALTIVFSLLASLLVALFVIPMAASLGLKGKTGNIKPNENPFKSIIKPFGSIQRLKNIKDGSGILMIIVRLVYRIPVFMINFLFELAGRVITLLIAVLAYGMGLLLTGVVKIIDLFFISFLGKYFNTMISRLTEWYGTMMESALRNRKQVIAGAAALFVLTMWLVFPRVGQELIPEVHQGEFYVDLKYPIGTPVEKTATFTESIEKYISGLNLVENVATVAGTDMNSINNTEQGEHTARLTVRLVPGNDLAESEGITVDSIRRYISNQPGVKTTISRPVLFSFRTPVEVVIKGYDLQQLLVASRKATTALSEIPGLTDIQTNLQSGNPEVQISYNRVRLATYGLDIRTVAEIVRNKVKGDIATEYRQEDRRIDVLVRLKENDRSTLQQLQRLNINQSNKKPIPLAAVADIKIMEGPSEVRRINQERSVVIGANITGGRSLSEVATDIFETMNRLDLPSDFTYEITGQNKEMEVSLASLRLALLLAIFLVYIVMASQFESFLHPFVILFTVPLAVIGVVWVLWIFNVSLSVVAFLGMIMLAGIVVNNAIVLVDYINHLRERGLNLKEAIIAGGKVRLRPILMTTMTTVLGLLPMSLGIGDGSEIRSPIGITVIAGLTSSTVLTLVVIPCVYFWAEELKQKVTKRGARS